MSTVGKEANAIAASGTASFEYTVDRYYYTPQKRFEQSLDVYRPVRKKEDHATNHNDPPRMPVVLVMGSGWLGHKPYFYLMTNWWNSSAPKQICGRLGHPCVSIRHSGGYLVGRKGVSSWLVLWALGSVVALVLAILAAPHQSPNLPMVVASIIPFMLLVLYWEGRGAAGIYEMVSDVSTALSYVDAHASEWGFGDGEALETDGEENGEKTAIVFGGYSSGAHVAATLLTASPLSPLLPPPASDGVGNDSLSPGGRKNQQQKLNHLHIKSVLYISGVLDVPPESYLMNLLSKVVLGEHPSRVPSPLRAMQSSQVCSVHESGTSTGNTYDKLGLLQPVSLPPHILIGCKREVFGLSVLDSAFCASEYTEALWSYKSQSPRRKRRLLNFDENSDEFENAEYNNKGDFVKLILLEGWAVNHWSILSSVALRNALRAVLGDGLDTTKTLKTEVGFLTRLFYKIAGYNSNGIKRPIPIAKGVYYDSRTKRTDDIPAVKSIDTMDSLDDSEAIWVPNWVPSNLQDHKRGVPLLVRRPEYDSYNEEDDTKLLKIIMAKARKLPQGPGMFKKIASNHVMVNIERTKKNIPPLRRERHLDQIAKEQAKLMADEKTLFHIDNPNELKNRMKEKDRESNELPPYERIGMNIESGKSIDEIHKFMLGSLATRNNIQDKRFFAMGMGTHTADNDELYMCQIFGG